MYVKDKMSTELITVNADNSIAEAVDLMQQKVLHRIPVVSKDGKLLGLLTKSLVNNNENSSLSVFELNYLLNKLKVSDLMIDANKVHTIDKDALLEEAATKMRKNNVGCLPVVENDKVVGIITHNDIFDAFIDILGYNRVGTRYVVDIDEDKVGVMNAISKCFVDNNISISNLAVYNTVRGIEIVVIAIGDNSSECKDALIKAGFNVTSMMNLNK